MKALIIVDLQNDFMPGGALPVPQGNQVVEVANGLMPLFGIVVATQDWHPLDHGSFASNHPGKKPGEIIDLDGIPQILWPNHCVQNCSGSEFHSELNLKSVTKIIQKGTNKTVDSYSGFYDNGHKNSTGLAEFLRSKEVEEAYVLGLATDYCVKFTALDSRILGFETFLVEDACRGVELAPGDSSKALEEMRKGGIRIIKSQNILKKRQIY